jgi:hypothetical protein
MAETLCNSQAHIPGSVFRQTWTSPTSLFKVHSLPLAIVFSSIFTAEHAENAEE